jgi:hypothetical protein
MSCRGIHYYLLVTLLLFSLISHACAQSSAPSSQKPGEDTVFFRDTRWGMTPDEVKQAEPDATFNQIGSYWMMDEPVVLFDQYAASVTYCFLNDGLAVAVALLTERHEQPNGYFSDYQDIKSMLTAEYGEAAADDIYWLSAEFENDPEKALAANAVQYMTSFVLGDTVIELILGPDTRNGQNVVTVQYANAASFPDVY